MTDNNSQERRTIRTMCPMSGLEPRHAAPSHGFATQHILNFEARPPGDYIPNQMSTILDAIVACRL